VLHIFISGELLPHKLDFLKWYSNLAINMQIASSHIVFYSKFFTSIFLSNQRKIHL
jgi:hypothetical protein